MSPKAAAEALAAWTFTRDQMQACDDSPPRRALPATDSRQVVSWKALDLKELHHQLSRVAGYTKAGLESAVDGLFRQHPLHLELKSRPKGSCLQLQPCSQNAALFRISNMALASNSTVCGHGVVCLA
jgi:hypothetical protein